MPEIQDVFVRPDARRLGIATALIEAIELEVDDTLVYDTLVYLFKDIA